MYGHILSSCKKRGKYGVARCKSIAAATVNKRRSREGRALGSVSRETGLGRVSSECMKWVWRTLPDPYTLDPDEPGLSPEERARRWDMHAFLPGPGAPGHRYRECLQWRSAPLGTLSYRRGFAARLLPVVAPAGLVLLIRNLP
jgi:hypothetical protein